MKGYFKVHRKILSSQVFANQTALKVWIWCLAKASYKERYVSIKIGKGEITVKITPGQFLFGRYKAEDELNIDGSTIYRWMTKFSSEEFGMITIKSNNQYSVVTICNWEEYQKDEDDELATNEQPTSNQRAADEQPTNTNNKDKNSKEGKEKSIGAKKTKFKIPSIEEIESYNKERKNTIDARVFFDYYQTRGWKLKGYMMKDWKAAVRTWEQNSNNYDNKQKHVPVTTVIYDRPIPEDLKRIMNESR